jgi:hypothetical protein
VKKLRVIQKTHIVKEQKKLYIAYQNIQSTTLQLIKIAFEQVGYTVYTATLAPQEHYDQLLYINCRVVGKKNDWFLFTKNNTFKPLGFVFCTSETEVTHDMQNIIHAFIHESDEIPKKSVLPTAIIPVQVAKPKRTLFNAQTKLFIAMVCCMLAISIAFIPLLFISNILTTRYVATTAKNYIYAAQHVTTLAEKSYSLVKPFYVSFSPKTSLAIDNIFATSTLAQAVALESIQIKNLMSTLLETNSILVDKKITLQLLQEKLNTTTKDIAQLNKQVENITFVNEETKDSLKKVSSALQKLNELNPHLPFLLGIDSERTYLLLFANNMELRPGGGFIGSFAIVKVASLQITNFTVYDVYDADGQLKARVAPPKPIEQHLAQPYFFLRDSAFEADFSVNATVAQRFIEQELGIKDISATALITTTAIQKMLKVFPKGIYLPEYKDTITNNNFYLKTQIAAEKDFFPGSTSKKSYLQALSNSIFNTPLSQEQFLSALLYAVEGLDEKYTVLNTAYTPLQNTFDNLYYSGRQVVAQCLNSKECIADSTLMLDANLGVNKANFFVQRDLRQDIVLDESGNITATYTTRIVNNSLAGSFPGGPYKNYLQLYLPKNVIVERVLIDNKEVTFDIEQQDATRLGFLVTTASSSTSNVVVKVKNAQIYAPSTHSYQLIVQKQVGMLDVPFTLSVTLPSNIVLKNKNFTALVNNNSIIYNTILSSDKLLLLELQKM